MIGKLFNSRYQIMEKLGSGGTAIVYKGQDTLLGRMVTIKILREEYASNEDFVRRFRREAQAVASLAHGNIVSVYDVGYETNMHYIVMEFVEGRSLKDYIKLRGALDAQEAATIMIQILDGISYAHEHGIVHRDIKPHNILLGKDGRAKVTDFGIAVGMSDVTQTYNTSSRIMGSVHYIAPEQVQGHPVTEKSDIYSAGVVFYEMLTGQLPFSGDTPISIAMQHVQGELTLPHQLNPRIPIGLSYVVMRAMRKNPDTRYDTAKEMSEAIRSVSEGLSSIYMPLPEENLASTRELDILAAGMPAGGGEKSKKRAATEQQPRQVERREQPEPRRRISFMSIFMSVSILIMVGALIAAIIWAVGQMRVTIDGDGTVNLPDFIGSQVDEAEAKLLDLDLKPIIKRLNDETVPINTVMRQDPSGNREVKVGREVTLTVSDGPKTTEVPTVLGETEMIAQRRLESKGLIAIYEEPEYSDDFPEGEIMRQFPEAGTAVTGGTEVVLVVSLGAEPVPVTVPDVLEKTLGDAKALLEEANLFYNIKFEPSQTYNADIVIAQSIAGGEEANEGDSIDLTVSQGPGPGSTDPGSDIGNPGTGSGVVSTTFVAYSVPNDGVSHHVRIVVEDSLGTHTPVDQNFSPNYPLYEMIRYTGRGSVTVYLDGEAKQTTPLLGGGQ